MPSPVRLAENSLLNAAIGNITMKGYNTNAKISTIYAGSSEIMKRIISRDCLSDDTVPFNTRNF